MRSIAVLAAGAAAAALAGCGSGGQPTAGEPLPRVQVSSGQGTDIGALPTIAPPPGLRSEKPSDGGGPATPTPTPTPTPTVTRTPGPTPSPPVETPEATPTFGPPDG